MKQKINFFQKNRRWFFLLLAVLLVSFFGWQSWNQNRPDEYLFLMGEVHSFEDFPMYTAFEKGIEENGDKVVILESDDKRNNIIEQTKILKENVNSHTVCIIVNASSNGSMNELLEEYRKKGIKVISCMNEVNLLYRDLHVGTADPIKTGKELLLQADRKQNGQKDSVVFGIVAGSPTSVSVTSMIQGIREAYGQSSADLLMADILYGYEDHDTAVERICELLKRRPQINTLLCVTEYMTMAAVDAVKGMETEDTVRIMGLGNQKSFEEALNDKLQLILLGCDMEKFGADLAQTARMLVAGEIEETAGKKIQLKSGEYVLEEDYDTYLENKTTSGLQLYLDPEPIVFCSSAAAGEN